MTCRDFAEFIDSYLARDLAAGTLASFEYHLSVCSNCRRYLAQYRDAIALGRTAFAHPAEAVPADVPEDLVAAILAARSVH
jgi:predicted anti-sigma-YlaC factor YlaD